MRVEAYLSPDIFPFLFALPLSIAFFKSHSTQHFNVHSYLHVYMFHTEKYKGWCIYEYRMDHINYWNVIKKERRTQSSGALVVAIVL